MKKLTLLIPLLLIFTYCRNQLHFIDESKIINIYNVAATVYNAEPSQCNSDYLHTADMSFINLRKVNDLRWIAASRDLINRWGGEFNYGDTVKVISTDSLISGLWILRDCMNERYTNRIDFLQCKHTGFYGKWDSIKIYNYEKTTTNICLCN